MGYDDVLPHVGSFGRYQCRIFAILLLTAIATSFHKIGGVFLGTEVDFRCLLPHESSETAAFQLLPNATNLTSLWNNETKKWPQCEFNYPSVADVDNATGKNTTMSTIKCGSFVYDEASGIQSIVTEWNLVCGDAWLKSAIESLFMFSNLPGVIFWGGVSDRHGRKKTLIWVAVTQSISAVLASFAPNFTTYAVLRILVGAATNSLFLVGYVSVVEMVGAEHRTTVGIVTNMFFTAAFMVSAGLAYLIGNWRYLQIVFTVPAVILLAFLWYVPESARWLLAKGRVQEARDIFKKISSANGRELSPDTLDELLSNATDTKQSIEKTTVLDLLRFPNLREKSIFLFFLWLISSATYYGLSWTASDLGGNVYVNSAISGSVELPASLLLILTLDRWGRKKILSGGMFLSAISLLLTYFVPSGLTWLTILLSMLGKFAITSAWGSLYIFTAELYPTAVRNVGVAACTAFANIGATLAPQLSQLSKVSTYLPLVLLGSSGFIAGLLSLRLPETLNQRLLETISDGENPKQNHRNRTQQDIEQLEKLKNVNKGDY